MPRGRAELSDKEQRILVQAQLMGLSTESMIRIGNRLKALDKEKEFKSRIAEACSGFRWEVKDNRHFTITDQTGIIFEVEVIRDYSKNDWSMSSRDYATITVSKPGTRYKKRVIRAHRLDRDWEADELVNACPEKNKFLYRMMRDIKRGNIER
jgi:hypothetical protein